MTLELMREGARILIAHLLDHLFDRQGARFEQTRAAALWGARLAARFVRPRTVAAGAGGDATIVGTGVS